MKGWLVSFRWRESSPGYVLVVALENDGGYHEPIEYIACDVEISAIVMMIRSYYIEDRKCSLVIFIPAPLL